MKNKTLLSIALTALLSGAFVTGCSNTKTTPPITGDVPTKNAPKDAANTGAFAQTDPWQLTTSDSNAVRGNHGIYLSNGTLGATFGKSGTGDKDSVVFRAGVYDANQALKPLLVGYTLNLPEPKTGESYHQTLDLKRGLLITEYGNRTITTFVSAAKPNIIVINVKGTTKEEATPTVAPEKLDKAEAVPGAAGIPTQYLCGDAVVGIEAGATDSFTMVYALAEEGTEQLAKDTAYNEAQSSLAAGFDALLKQHVQEWEHRWDTASIAIDGDPEAQQLVNKLTFDLLQSVRPGGSDSIAPEALSGDFYKGHIFWDADVWMFPALLAQYPETARNLLDYRFKHLEEARSIARSESLAGADYPWESAANGKETAPSGFSTERHVTAGVGFAAWQYFLATGDTTWLRERGYPVLSAVADHFASRAKKNATTQKYEIKGVFGPDENRGKVDNNTYTNALAKYCLEAATKAAKALGKPANPQWADVAKNITLPFDKEKGAYLARDADELRSTKQADGELVLYPARLPMEKATADKTFALHASRPIKSGPAMTASMHALIAARLGRSQESEAYFRDSYRPFVRGPFVLFSEKRSLERCVFTTGAGGILQSVLYGYAGIDFDTWDKMAQAPVALPSTWKSLTIHGVQYHGKRYTVTVTQSGRTITPE